MGRDLRAAVSLMAVFYQIGTAAGEMSVHALEARRRADPAGPRLGRCRQSAPRRTDERSGGGDRLFLLRSLIPRAGPDRRPDQGRSPCGRSAGTTGPAISGLIDAALRASKQARTQTTISTEGISLARAGLEVAAVQLSGLSGRDAVVLGTGSIGKLAARLLREAGVRQLSVASRRETRAADVAASMHCRYLRASDVPAKLAEADILVTATGAAVPVVAAEQARAGRARAGRRPLFVLDLGMPPDVDPAVGRLPGVTLVDLTTLGRHLQRPPARSGRLWHTAVRQISPTAATEGPRAETVRVRRPRTRRIGRAAGSHIAVRERRLEHRRITSMAWLPRQALVSPV